MLPVLILAGSRDGERDPLAQLGKVSHKALLPIAGIPMIERVVSALESTPDLGPIWVSIETPSCLEFLGSRVRLLKAASTPSESVAQALEHIGTPCLITTADHALLSPQWVQEFLEKSRASQASLTAGVASAQNIQRDVPDTKRTYIKLSDLTFSGCNLFYCHDSRARSVVALWQNLQRNRKHPVKMAWTLGIPTLIRFILRQLDTQGIERRITRLTDAPVKIITLHDGRVSIDVDKVADFCLVSDLLKKEKKQS